MSSPSGDPRKTYTLILEDGGVDGVWGALDITPAAPGRSAVHLWTNLDWRGVLAETDAIGLAVAMAGEDAVNGHRITVGEEGTYFGQPDWLDLLYQGPYSGVPGLAPGISIGRWDIASVFLPEILNAVYAHLHRSGVEWPKGTPADIVVQQKAGGPVISVAGGQPSDVVAKHDPVIMVGREGADVRVVGGPPVAPETPPQNQKAYTSGLFPHPFPAGPQYPPETPPEDRGAHTADTRGFDREKLSQSFKEIEKNGLLPGAGELLGMDVSSLLGKKLAEEEHAKMNVALLIREQFMAEARADKDVEMLIRWMRRDGPFPVDLDHLAAAIQRRKNAEDKSKSVTSAPPIFTPPESGEPAVGAHGTIKPHTGDAPHANLSDDPVAQDQVLAGDATKWDAGMAVEARCAHVRPMSGGSFYGVCVQCWRDRCLKLDYAYRTALAIVGKRNGPWLAADSRRRVARHNQVRTRYLGATEGMNRIMTNLSENGRHQTGFGAYAENAGQSNPQTVDPGPSVISRPMPSDPTPRRYEGPTQGLGVSPLMHKIGVMEEDSAELAQVSGILRDTIDWRVLPERHFLPTAILARHLRMSLDATERDYLRVRRQMTQAEYRGWVRGIREAIEAVSSAMNLDDAVRWLKQKTSNQGNPGIR